MLCTGNFGLLNICSFFTFFECWWHWKWVGRTRRISFCLINLYQHFLSKNVMFFCNNIQFNHICNSTCGKNDFQIKGWWSLKQVITQQLQSHLEQFRISWNLCISFQYMRSNIITYIVNLNGENIFCLR